MAIDANFSMNIPQDADFPDSITVERNPETREYIHPGIFLETEKELNAALDGQNQYREKCKDLYEQVAALESKEVCTAPHDDDVIKGCPYCKIEELRKDVHKRFSCEHLPIAWTKRWVCSSCCEIIDTRSAQLGRESDG